MVEIPAQSPGDEEPDRKNRLLIVVDGDTSHLYYTGVLLQRLAYTIYTAKTAEEALEIIAITMPALVLTEAVLPKMGGLELLKQIRQNPRTKAVPVIMYTASKDPELKDACLREGCAGYLSKPVDADALYTAIQQVTEKTPRNYIRFNTCLNVVVEDDSTSASSSLGDCVTAMSESGMYVSTSRPRPVGTLIPMTIHFYDKLIKVEGAVLYSFVAGQGPLRTPGMGIKFTRIEPKDRDLIRSFIGKQVTGGILKK